MWISGPDPAAYEPRAHKDYEGGAHAKSDHRCNQIQSPPEHLISLQIETHGDKMTHPWYQLSEIKLVSSIITTPKRRRRGRQNRRRRPLGGIGNGIRKCPSGSGWDLGIALGVGKE